MVPGLAGLLSPRPPAQPRGSRAPQETDGYRAIAVEFIRTNTAPGEGIFVGTWRHQRPYLNEVALYFLADRPGASRYTQFEPNVISRLAVQREIATELGRKGTRVLVLSSCCSDSNEPNESRRLGSTFLDEYIAAHYRVVGTFGRYAFLVRSSAG